MSLKSQFFLILFRFFPKTFGSENDKNCCKNRSVCMIYCQVLKLFCHVFYRENDKNCRFFACKLSFDRENAWFSSQKFRRFQALGRRDIRAVSCKFGFRQSTFRGLFTGNASVISDVILAKFAKFFLSNSTKEAKFLLFCIKFKPNTTISFRSVGSLKLPLFSSIYTAFISS